MPAKRRVLVKRTVATNDPAAELQAPSNEIVQELTAIRVILGKILRALEEPDRKSRVTR